MNGTIIKKMGSLNGKAMINFKTDPTLEESNSLEEVLSVAPTKSNVYFQINCIIFHSLKKNGSKIYKFLNGSGRLYLSHWY